MFKSFVTPVRYFMVQICFNYTKKFFFAYKTIRQPITCPSNLAIRLNSASSWCRRYVQRFGLSTMTPGRECFRREQTPSYHRCLDETSPEMFITIITTTMAKLDKNIGPSTCVQTHPFYIRGSSHAISPPIIVDILRMHTKRFASTFIVRTATL